jgi:galactokinase
MQVRLSIIRQAAQALGAQFKNHQLRDFVPRRLDELTAQVEAATDETVREERLHWLEAQLEIFERQLPIQNTYWKGNSVIENEP